MSVPSTSWNESSPAGSDALNAGDNRIREMKTQIREVIDVDHKFASSGSDADNGCHDQVTLLEKADLGTGAVGKTILGSQTVSAKGELVYTDEDDTDIVLTKGGGQNYSAPSALANMAGIMNLIYPVGFVVTLGVSTNPGTLLGIGTWTAIAGRVIVGIDAGQTEFDTLDETGGAKTVTLTAAQSGSPSHTHNTRINNSGAGSGNTPTFVTGQGQMDSGIATTSNTPADAAEAHSNLQPYICKYVWQRVS
jgi:hypothetical protein